MAHKTGKKEAESILCLGWRACGADGQGVHISKSSAPAVVLPGREFKDLTVAASHVLPLAGKHHFTRVVMEYDKEPA
ncbi:MAG: hypothetical protein RBR86_03505 [Pseudobdellovibrionaceae bacterium]|nr:hypothetical protein [Pseudobdellovibrionaceae bacterium]